VITAETVERLTGFDAGELPVVSLYVGVDPSDYRKLPSQVSSLLHEARAWADNGSLAREARLSLRKDLERIEQAAAEERWQGGGTALFACSGAGLYEKVQLPRATRDRVVVDRTPWVRPMLELLDEFHRYCVVVVDKRTARAWELYQGELLEERQVNDEALRKPDFAGFAGYEEKGIQNKSEELAKRHYRHVAELVEELFRGDGYELLIVGGHQDEVPQFLEQLPHHLRERLAGSFTTDLRTASAGQVREQADAVVERYEREYERKRVTELLETVAAGGRATLGLESCLWAGSVAAIEELLIQDGAAAEGVACNDNHWLALEGETCPICGQQVRDTPDVIDELAEAVFESGGSIEHVVADTELKPHVTAASLRFPLPPDPRARERER
jgi:peptide chain release factor subunit 1